MEQLHVYDYMQQQPKQPIIYRPSERAPEEIGFRVMGKRKVAAPHTQEEKAEASDSEQNEEEASGSEPASSSSDEAEESESSQDLVNVDFEFFDPKPEDFHGVKALLRTYLDDTEWDLSGFVDLIIAQRTVGTVMKAGEDESPIGVITALNIRRYKEIPSIQAVGNLLLKHGQKKTEISKLEELWHSKENVGLLVSERVLNVPLELCPPLYEGLFDEIAWATEDEPSDTLRDSYKFKHYLILTRVYQEVCTKKISSKAKRTKKPTTGQAHGDGGFVFIKPEDELFFQLSTWSFTFPVKAEAMAAKETKGLKLLRLVMAVKANQVSAFKSKLKHIVENTEL